MLDVYSCKSCGHTQLSKETPKSCEKCGGVLDLVYGVQVAESGEETKKYAHELSRQSRHYSSEK